MENLTIDDLLGTDNEQKAFALRIKKATERNDNQWFHDYYGASISASVENDYNSGNVITHYVPA